MIEAPAAAHPNAAVRALVDGLMSPYDFRAHLREVGTPLIDPVKDPDPAARIAAGQAPLVNVTFVRDLAVPHSDIPAKVRSRAVDPGTRAASGQTQTTVMTLIDRALPARSVFTDIPGTELRVQTITMPADLRFTYALIDLADDGSAWLADDVYNRVAQIGDPKLGRHIAELPQAQSFEPVVRQALEQVRTDVETGAPVAPRLEEMTFDSRILGNSRSVWVSPPPPEYAGPHPYLLLFDGVPDHSAPRLRDALLAAELIRPVTIVLVDEAGLRDSELTANDSFTRALAEELLPLLRERFDLSTDPADAALSGKSLGGLCAAVTALDRPDLFGNAIMHSPSAWYQRQAELLPGVPRAQHGQGAGQGEPELFLVERFRRAGTEAAAGAPRVRVYQECGDQELGPPPAHAWQILANRWLHQTIVAAGFETEYHEFRGGHDAAWWDGTRARTLIWAFGV